MDGLCHCGCGRPTKLAERNRRDRGWVEGKSVPFIHGHNPTQTSLRMAVSFFNRARLFPTAGQPDCMEWGGFVNENGYGMTSLLMGERAVHRIAYTLAHGPIPSKLEPDHLCRNRRCMNYTHLELVTRKVNSWRGAKSKLTLDLASEIRASSETDRGIGARLGVHHSTINAVRAGRSWVE